jgi:hypothetical protein
VGAKQQIRRRFLGLDRKSAKKLASLSALGAGAIALSSGTAEASIIYSGSIDVKVGFSCGCGGYQSAGYTFLFGPNLVGYGILSLQTRARTRTIGTGPTAQYRYLGWVSARGFAVGRLTPNSTGSPGSHYTSQRWKFQVQANPFTYGPAKFMRLVSEGVAWGGGSTAAGTVPILQRSFQFTGPSTGSTISYNNYPNPIDPNKKYALFSFNDPGCGSGTCYGWLELGLNFQPTGPNVDLLGWAFDDSGAPLGAGVAPEPSTFVLTGLAALALGAKGLRRWRAARKS